jgi:hypothetical protein
VPGLRKKGGKPGNKYPQFTEGEAMDMNWRERDFKMSCCDCGLVHVFRFAVSGRFLRIRGWRDNRATGQVRRRIKREIKDARIA